MASTATNVGLLTRHLKGEDFFDTNHYPTAQFITERIVPTPDAGRYQVTGRMTIHGVSQSVTFPARIVLTGDEVAFDATLTLSQTAFGMTEAARKTQGRGAGDGLDPRPAKMTARVLASDIIVVGVPMCNFGIPLL